jgi:3-phosphoshikimate 1-carboxyvinyltransferase
MAEGTSAIEYPLDSLDARSCVAVCRGLGTDIEERWRIEDGNPNPAGADGKKLAAFVVTGRGKWLCGPAFVPRLCDVGNSGTTLYLGLAAAALGMREVRFDGDEQIRRRSAGPLLNALAALGMAVNSAPGGCAPVSVRGPWKGGRVSIECPTSQYLSALLLAAPLAPAGVVTEIDVPLLNERPYVELTAWYHKTQGINFEYKPDFSWFRIPGGQAWKPLSVPVPGDFSSAAFPAAAAAVTGGPATLLGLDPSDPQGDKVFLDYLAQMGCRVAWEEQEGGPACIVSRTGALKAGEFDLNNTPDLLPVMAVLGAFAKGDTALVNAASARIKETDRIACMGRELDRLGVRCTERDDALIVHGQGGVGGAQADSYGDHRIALALAVAALGADSPITIDRAECAAVTYPGFLELLRQ